MQLAIFRLRLSHAQHLIASTASQRQGEELLAPLGYCDHIRGDDRGRDRSRLRPHRTQPPCGEPGTRNRKLRPAAIKANQDVRRRSHGGMAEGTMTIAVKTNLRRNDGQRRRLAFWAIHETPLGKKHQKTQINSLRKK